jgi:hypothetical protein
MPSYAGSHGQTGRVFTLEPDHLGIETYDDTVAQIAWSHHGSTPTGDWYATPRHAATYGRPDSAYGQDHRLPGPAPLGSLAPDAN